ncbi:MAG: DUF4190 domain-containing protein [Pirellulales bacterium]|nr:DUF4190 domain-containing protein [Pirellulales bacterium]
MTDPIQRPHLSPLQDDPQEQYQAVSALAVASLIVGLLSSVALFGPHWWFVPGIGILLAIGALAKIAARTPELIGRKAAVVGLLLSVWFVGSAMGYHLTRESLLDREASRAALDWFGLLAHRKPHMAYQLTQPLASRRPLSDALWELYRNVPEQGDKLKKYVTASPIETLLALGTDATVRYCGTLSRWHQDNEDGRNQIFAVTYDDPKEGKTTFFIGVSMQREANPVANRLNWTVVGCRGGVTPPWLANGDPLKECDLCAP